MGTKRLAAVFITLVCTGFIGGCGNPGIVQLSPDTYLLAREDKAGIFGNAQALKAGVIRDANAFAEKQGKVAIPVSSRGTPAWPLHFATFEYQFRVVDKNDPEAQGAVLVPRADITVQVTGAPSGTAPPHDPPRSPDLYTELNRLDELRKRGLLTDAEFEAEKRALLKRSK
ncbi:MAG: SHOCT domain-containing protein [Phycisphaerales bacterium]